VIALTNDILLSGPALMMLAFIADEALFGPLCGHHIRPLRFDIWHPMIIFLSANRPRRLHGQRTRNSLWTDPSGQPA